ncbi:HNH endonuclease [Pseudomonas moorei]|uniref:HNH endonuclease n=1 Tax=Pseudomonas moorei TaxID=395599 RepID=UPI001FF1F647|nr:HNH endonuclease signature motif containing protein [Pseudomonas moorei]
MTEVPLNIQAPDEQGLRLLNLLVSMLPKIRPNDPRTFISYKQVHDVLGLSQHGTTFGRSLLLQGLDSLAHWTAKSGKPGITGLIIDKDKMLPGEGYFTLFNREPEDYNWWFAEVQKSKNFNWAPYLSNKSEDLCIAGDDWTGDELRASVVAYLEMQRLDRAGIPFKKSEFYDALVGSFSRTSSAFEHRMHHISYVLALMGRDWLTGLKPATNVSVSVAEQIEKLIAEVEKRPFAAVAAFEIAVREGIQKEELLPPEGRQIPRYNVSSVTQFQRDASVKAWVLKVAKGVCECCEQPAPFETVDGLPFLEVHHVRKLAENGADTISNAVATCPNCHRALHYGAHAKDLIEHLYLRVARLKRE